ncbi:uncharacterized protein G2W53_044923 [Senna tora]|uniref:DUF4216 domain-containing protein n=1 Tax=Senna tora TaxID=362788 RepID=A0A834VXL2_9FABA|nr:uncharacterized protein G2W53_044923 [Senna tora]
MQSFIKPVCRFYKIVKRKYMDNQALTSNETDYSDFPDWFQAHVFKLCAENKATDELISLAVGPDKVAKLYPMIMVNGFRFHTRARALGKKTQNSGVLVKGDDLDTAKEYYGVLDHIYELSYMGNRKVYLFKCAWWDVSLLGRGYKIDKYGFISVNTHCSLKTNEPFVLASQAEQVFYVNDIVNEDWLIVVKTSPCDLFNMPDEDVVGRDEQGEAYQQSWTELNVQTNDEIDDDITVTLHRVDIDPENIILTSNDVQRGKRGVQILMWMKETTIPMWMTTILMWMKTTSNRRMSLMSRVSKGRRRRGNHGLVHETNDEDEAMSSSQLPQLQQNNDETQRSVIPHTSGPSSKINVKGRYRGEEVNKLTKNGEKIEIDLVKGMKRVVGAKARMVANECGNALRTWKSNLHEEYKAYATDELRLENQPDSISPEDWRWLLEYFATPQFKAQSERNKINRSKQTTKHCCGPKSFAEVEEATRDLITGELAPPNIVWEMQHARANTRCISVSRIQELVNEQAEVPVEEPRMSRDEILASVLGERSGYVRGKGYGAIPAKRKLNQTEDDSRVSSAIETARA